MSDDNEHEHEHNHPPFFAVQMGPPPEVVERQRMEGEANAHETRQFLDSLNETQLRKFAGLMMVAAQTEGTMATYYMGIAAGILDWKFHACLACGKNHDKPFEEMEQKSDIPLDGAGEMNLNRECCNTLNDAPHTYACHLMLAYNVEPDDDGSLKVMCKNCNTWHSSLEDRMMRKADKSGCQGCQQKEKWG